MRRIVFTALTFVSFCFFAGDLFAVSWRDNFSKALQEAKSGGTLIMADFYTDWCVWCNRLDKDTYSDKKVDELSKRFICVKINGDKEPAVAMKYGVRGYPTIMFFDPDGKVLDTIVGYVKPDQMINFMNKVIESASKTDLSKGQRDEAAVIISGGSTEEKERPIIEQSIDTSNLKLQGVIITDKTSSAMINGEIFHVGSVINGAVITEISDREVVIKMNDKEAILRL